MELDGELGGFPHVPVRLPSIVPVLHILYLYIVHVCTYMCVPTQCTTCVPTGVPRYSVQMYPVNAVSSLCTLDLPPALVGLDTHSVFPPLISDTGLTNLR